MANTRKNTKTKESSATKTPSITEETKVVKEEVVAEKKVKAELTADTKIEVISLVNNCTYEDKTNGLIYRWEHIGDVIDMSYADIQVMFRTTPNMLRRMFVFVDNQEVMEQLRLGELYKAVKAYRDIDYSDARDADSICSVIAELIKKYPVAKNNILTSLIAKVHEGDVTDLHLLYKLEDALNLKGILVNATIR